MNKQKTVTQVKFASCAEARAHFVLKGYRTIATSDSHMLVRKPAFYDDPEHDLTIAKTEFDGWVVK